MFKNALSHSKDYGINSVYKTGIFLLIVIFISGCSLSLFGIEGSDIWSQETPSEEVNQNQTLAAGFSNIMTATIASTQQASTVPSSVATSSTGATATLESGNDSIIKFKEIDGSVQVRQNSQSSFITATLEDELAPDGQVKTLDLSKVRLELSDQSIIRLDSNSLLTFVGKETSSTGLLTQLNLETGKLWVILKSGSLEITTPFGVASVSGSYMSVDVDPATSTVYITCLDGKCSLQNGINTADLVAGQTGIITNITPEVGIMTDEEVDEWLTSNPEATTVIPQLTLTAQPLSTKTLSTPVVAPTTVHSTAITQAPK
jgi:hypothetical protein